MTGRSFTVTSDLALEHRNASGVIAAVGSKFGGWSLYLDRGRPAMTYARGLPEDQTYEFMAKDRLPTDASELKMTFKATVPGGPAHVTLESGGTVYVTGMVPQTFLMTAGLGEMFDVGRDTGVPVTDYRRHEGRLEGEITHLVVEFMPRPTLRDGAP